MKRAVLASAALLPFLVAMAGLAHAAEPVPGLTAEADAAGAEVKPTPICLDPAFIDHTQIVDDSTILFHMKGGKVWKNTLASKCFGLKMQGGFAYEVQGGTICSNMQTIRVLDQGSICSLGDFTPYTPPAPAEKPAAK